MSAQELSIQNLHISESLDGTRKYLLEGVSLKLQRGKILGLLGASGSGKTIASAAMLDVLPQNLKAEYDHLLLDGKPVSPAALRGKKIASIMQNPRSAFNPLRTMYFHAAETLKAVGKWNKNANKKINTAIQDAGLGNHPEILSSYAFQLSGGQLQRMMIALALLSDAPFLIADEPTSDLDLVAQHHILNLLKKHAAERNLGVLLITHDLSVMAYLADEIAVINQGKIVEQAKIQDIFSRPLHHTTQTLLRAHLSLYNLQAADL